ncbi:hypothetical protein ABFT23_04335 [Nocardioides sp. C4-1]
MGLADLAPFDVVRVGAEIDLVGHGDAVPAVADLPGPLLHRLSSRE